MSIKVYETNTVILLQPPMERSAFSVTRLGEILPTWIFLKVLGHLLKVYIVFGKMFNQLWQICYAFGQIYSVVS